MAHELKHLRGVLEGKVSKLHLSLARELKHPKTHRIVK
jgi:hypothetical protein